MKYDQLREQALANFELLLNYWGIEYKLIGDNEYDFLNPTRRDTNFGACRFNIEKGIGSDFAGRGFERNDFSRFGIGFTADDFSGVTRTGESVRNGFDIIGLVQRIYKIGSYKEAAELLRDELSKLKSSTEYITPAKDAAERRKEKQRKNNERIVTYANNVWNACRDIKLEGSLAEEYFKSRGLFNVKEQNIRFHPSIKNRELKQTLPAVLFKVQASPKADLSAIHRIYLTQHGRKANVAAPKMALAKIANSAIWFGEPSEQLAIAEGPENALTARYCYNFGFVCSTISASNFSALTIPSYVKQLVLLPDEDDAGINSYKKAVKAYQAQGIKHIQRAMLDWGKLDELVRG